MASKIVIGINKTKFKIFQRLLKNPCYSDGVEIIESVKDLIHKQYHSQLVLLCIDNNVDLIRYVYFSKRLDKSKLLLTINKHAVLAPLLTLKENVIYCVESSMMAVIRGILDAIVHENVLGLKYEELLSICGRYRTVWGNCWSGEKEIVLFRILKEREKYKKRKCCLVNVTGAVTLQDVSDVFSVLSSSYAEEIKVGCVYDEEEGENIKVFCLWRS